MSTVEQTDCSITLNCYREDCVGTMDCRVDDTTEFAYYCSECQTVLTESQLNQARMDDGPLAAHITHYSYDH